MTRLDLGGDWRLASADGTIEAPARVPGSVIADLLAAGRIPDPYAGLNEYPVRDLFRSDFVYAREFDVPADLLAHDAVELACDGLDTLATIRLNGVEVGACDNMHVAWRFDVKRRLRPGANTIEVRFASPIRFIEEAARRDGAVQYVIGGSMLGAGFLRKAHCMFGWDWGPQLPDAGIWRPIAIEGASGARIDDLAVAQDHRDGRVLLSGVIDARRLAPGGTLSAAVELEGPDGDRCAAAAAFDGDRGTWSIDVARPRLWWPAGYGGQPLYRLSVALSRDGREVDRRSLRLGLRTLRLSRERDAWGEEFCFAANGVKIFAMGANYIPEDGIISRTSAARTRRLLEDCRRANFNTVRVWGGGYYPEDWFFDACDELGLVAWLDLMFACNVYRAPEAFLASVEREVDQNLRRVRHHACLGLVCGNNEMEVAWADWPQVKDHHPSLKADYLRLFEFALPPVVRRAAPGIDYWPSSPSSGGSFDNPNDPDRGDVHYWEVWHRQRPIADYRRHRFRFCSEFGFQSFPSVPTVRTFAEPGDMNVFSPVMESHQKNGAANGKILGYLAETHRYPTSFRTLVYASQLLQAEAIRTAVEHWRRYRGRCMGALYWQVNDCWPVASWAGIEYGGRWKPLHHAAARFFAPVLLTAAEDGGRVELHVGNETRQSFTGTVRWFLRDNAGAVAAEGRQDVTVEPLATRVACVLDLADRCGPGAPGADRHVLDYRLEAGGAAVGRGSLLFVAPKRFRFLPPDIAAEVIEDADGVAVRLRAARYAREVWLELDEADGRFDDNLVDLFPDEPRVLRLARDGAAGALDAAAVRRQLVVLHAADL